VYLTILLIERAFRDDKRCAEKYGIGWEQYCHYVPYKIIPFVI
jgi:7-dehydrocholesterol reductase